MPHKITLGISTLNEIEQFINDHIGIDVKKLGNGHFRSQILSRMKVLRIYRGHDYKELLEYSPTELAELIELLIVSKADFFLLKSTHKAFIEHVQRKTIQALPHRPLRILSLPCATGEEPYSIAMSLLSLGLKPHHFRIDAYDICEELVKKAVGGVYHRSIQQFSKLFFNQVKGGYVVTPEVKSCVHFGVANVLDCHFWLKKGKYDVIFLCNLLTYFTDKARDEALEIIKFLLEPDGLLIVDPAESHFLRKSGFEVKELPSTFVLAKKNNNTAKSRRQSVKVNPSDYLICSETEPSLHDLHMQARLLTDKGRFEEAQKICDAILTKFGITADSYFILGRIKMAQEELRPAKKYLQKAVQIDGDHHEALAYLAFLFENPKESVLVKAGSRKNSEKKD